MQTIAFSERNEKLQYSLDGHLTADLWATDLGVSLSYNLLYSLSLALFLKQLHSFDVLRKTGFE